MWHGSQCSHDNRNSFWLYSPHVWCFFSAGTDTSISLHHFLELCRRMISGLCAWTVLSVWICCVVWMWLHHSLNNPSIPYSREIFQWRYLHILVCFFKYSCSILNNRKLIDRLFPTAIGQFGTYHLDEF